MGLPEFQAKFVAHMPRVELSYPNLSVACHMPEYRVKSPESKRVGPNTTATCRVPEEAPCAQEDPLSTREGKPSAGVIGKSSSAKCSKSEAEGQVNYVVLEKREFELRKKC